MGISQKPKLTSISQSKKGKWERKNQIYLFMFFVLCRSNESDFHYIKSYCPYQNIRDKVWFSLVFLFFWLSWHARGGTPLKVEYYLKFTMGVCRWVLETLDLLQTQRDELESCSWNQLRDKSKSGAYQSLIENNQALWWKSTLFHLQNEVIYVPLPREKGLFLYPAPESGRQ